MYAIYILQIYVCNIYDMYIIYINMHIYMRVEQLAETYIHILGSLRTFMMKDFHVGN